MTKSSLGMVLLASLGLIGACGSNSDPVTTQPECTIPTGPGCKIAVEDGSFVRWTGPSTDGTAGGTSTGVVTYTPGKYCMSGSVDSGPNDAGWGSILVLSLTDKDDTGKLVAPFDAAAVGLKQVRFTLEGPPPQGVLPQALQITSADCTQLPDCLATFSLAAPVLDSGTVTAQLTDFTQAGGSQSNTSLDQTLMMGIQFYVPPLPGMTTPYDFCVRDLALLDADGKVLRP